MSYASGSNGYAAPTVVQWPTTAWDPPPAPQQPPPQPATHHQAHHHHHHPPAAPRTPAAASGGGGGDTTLTALSPDQMRQILSQVANANPDLLNAAMTQHQAAAAGQQQQTLVAEVEPAPAHHHHVAVPAEPWNRYNTTTDAHAVTHHPDFAVAMESGMPQQYEMTVPQEPVQQHHQDQIQPQPQTRHDGKQPGVAAHPGHRHKSAGKPRAPKQGANEQVQGEQQLADAADAAPAAPPQKNTTTWELRFADLALYKARKGTCIVSQKDDAALNRWVANQRKQRRLLLEGKNSALTEERIEMLESIGFEWGGRGRAGGKTGQRRAWDEWLDDLAAWKAQHGDCLVPQKHPSGLGLWVAKQRQNFRLWMNGQPSPMTRERVASLETLGFHFQSVLPPKTPWHEWLEQLRKYKEKHGDCRVRTGKGTEYSQLGKWVDRQRQHYSLRKKGKGAAMTDERIRLLEEAGFEWTVPRTGRPPKPKDPAEEERKRKLREQNLGPDGLPLKLGKRPGMTHKEKWDSRFEELKDYKEEHGTTRVPGGKRRDGTFSSLGKWCDHQRQLYKRRQEGKKCSMTDERLQLLEDIGFEWILREEIADGTLEALTKKEKEWAKQNKKDGVSTPAKKCRKMQKTAESNEDSKKSSATKASTPVKKPTAGISPSADGKNLSGAQNEKWLTRLDELLQYKKKFGNCRVPAGKCKEKNYSQLGKWVDHQRQQYRLRSIGKPSTLTDARLEKLVELGFEFVVTRRIHKGRAPPHVPKNKPKPPTEEGKKDDKGAMADKEDKKLGAEEGETKKADEEGTTRVYGTEPEKGGDAPTAAGGEKEGPSFSGDHKEGGDKEAAKEAGSAPDEAAEPKMGVDVDMVGVEGDGIQAEDESLPKEGNVKEEVVPPIETMGQTAPAENKDATVLNEDRGVGPPENDKDRAALEVKPQGEYPLWGTDEEPKIAV